MIGRGPHHTSGRRSATEPGPRRPRVVILEADEDAHVEVVDLPASASTGTVFDHSGTTWRVTATRTHERVFIARPAQS